MVSDHGLGRGHRPWGRGRSGDCERSATRVLRQGVPAHVCNYVILGQDIKDPDIGISLTPAVDVADKHFM